jgi:hypothetical protein
MGASRAPVADAAAPHFSNAKVSRSESRIDTSTSHGAMMRRYAAPFVGGTFSVLHGAHVRSIDFWPRREIHRTDRHAE